MNGIRSHIGDGVYTEEVNKVALCPNDDKRQILGDQVNTLALGHYNILYKNFAYLIKSQKSKNQKADHLIKLSDQELAFGGFCMRSSFKTL